MEKCHLIGIGGIGMSGLARILLRKNIAVTGSDQASSYVTDHLQQAGVKVYIGHDARYITPNTTVVYSTDIKTDNPEFQAAQQLKCKMWHRSDLLHYLMEGHQTLAISGTHGKTTTTSLLTCAMLNEGLDPGYAIGGMLSQTNTNASHGEGKYFVAEADESDGTFLKYKPYGAIITNIDLDHMNHFVTEEALVKAFKQFASQVESAKHLFWCGDDPRLQGLHLPGTSYGFGAKCALRAVNVVQKGWMTTFDIEYQGRRYPQVKLNLTGKHNVLNALAVFGLGLAVTVKEGTLRDTFTTFKGVKRRCEKKAEIQKIILLDDYAHHPVEIKTTLEGIRTAVEERQLVAVFQPHRYTRTRDCLGSYGTIFEAADTLFITDIYAGSESPIPGISHEAIMKEIQQHSTIPCRYVPRAQLADALAKFLRPHDVMVSLGAGDITKISGEIQSLWEKNPIEKIKLGVICGGTSVEHEVALSSANTFCKGLSSDYYDIRYFGINKQGQWLCGPNTISELHAQVKEKKSNRNGPKISATVMEQLQQCDVFFPMLHGPFGEDGTIQGFFEMLDKAYVGSDYRASAISMDKALSKIIASAAGVPVAPYVAFTQKEWQQDQKAICHQIKEKLKFPIFVKPSHLGSSIAVQKIENEDQLSHAIANVFRVDTAAIVETGIKGREIEFALFGSDVVTVFPPGEVFTEGKVYDYEAKYSEHGFRFTPHADLPEKVRFAGMEFAKRAYIAAGCNGFARIDFFLDDQGHYWFNEINPIPGHTPTSLYPQITAYNGLSMHEFDDKLIRLALQRKRQKGRLEQVL